MLPAEHDSPPAPTFELTEREMEVMEHIWAGNTSEKAIAEELGIGVQTVKQYLHRIYKKLGLLDGFSERKKIIALLAVLRAGKLKGK